MDLILSEIKKAIVGKSSHEFDSNAKIRGVSIDSRTIKKGEIFFALKGRRIDSHNFIGEAKKGGATAVVVSAGRRDIEGGNIIYVSDTKNALCDLAAYYRRKINPVVLAVTGSNGKTTTKEILYFLLSKKYRTIRNIGNFNTEIGLPLTIFQMTRKTEVLVLEMGMTGKGDIDLLSKISMPDIGIITNIGPAHLEFFSSLKEIASVKAELIQNLSASSRLILNRDDRFYGFFKGMARCPVWTFGIEHKSDFQARSIKLFPFKGTEFFLTAQNQKIKVKTGLSGLHNVYNTLAAIAAVSCVIKDLKSIADGIKVVQPQAMRLERKCVNGIEIINDAYNANPDSVEAALSEFGKYKIKGKKIFVFADMLELGPRSDFFHREIGKEIVRQKIDFLIVRGEKAGLAGMSTLKHGMAENRVFFAKDNMEISSLLSRLLKKHDAVLLKGSRLMRLEEVAELLQSARGGLNWKLKIGNCRF